MKKLSLIFIFLFLFCDSCLANVFDYPKKFSDISKQLPELNSIKCNFKQEKHLQNIQKPLISGGDFEFKKNEGVYFYTTYPIKSTKNFTNKNYKQINDIINGISSKKYSKLEKEFDFYFEGGKTKWTLGLKPKKNSSVVNYISTITISGEDYIKQISIILSNGNKTYLWFTK